MKYFTIFSILFLSLCSTPTFATKEFTVSKPTVTVYELNNGLGKVQCKLKKRTKVMSDWSNQDWSYIKTKKPIKCQGWVETKNLKG